MEARAKTNKSLKIALDNEKEHIYDRDRELARSVKIVAYHSASNKKLVNYEI